MLKGLTQNEKRAESKSTGPRYSKSVQRYPVGVKGGIVWIHYPVQIEVKLREGSVACLHYGKIILPLVVMLDLCTQAMLLDYSFTCLFVRNSFLLVEGFKLG